ncbi:hypothetical protein BDW74DRAFT_142589 [Aspergillus multicolor]|uniref:putative respiratory complex assembly protein Rmp1 n=1 Tax=Aspergillus multicolor TaxID=41759 RepID=UPI003CCDDF99
MFSQPYRHAGGLLNCQLLSTCRRATAYVTSSQRDVQVRYQNTASDSNDFNDSGDNSRDRNSDGLDRRGSGYNRTRHKRAPRKPIRRIEKEKHHLDVPALGEPGEVLLVKARDERRFIPTPRVHKKADADHLPVMLQDLVGEPAQIDRTVVDERIDRVRRSYRPHDRLTLDAWEDIRNGLRHSFTIPQLSAYVSRTLTGKENNPEGNLTLNGEMRFWAWKPGTSRFLETGKRKQESVAERVTANRHLKQKDFLVERILRDCWELGLVTDVGQLDIQIPAHLLSLLIDSEIFSFEELANLNETTIDVTKSLGLVRVTGKQRACESIREIIHDYTNRIESRELSLLSSDDPEAKTVAQALNNGFLSWVEKMYKVSFERNSSQIPNRLYLLAENKANADDARRMMNLAVNKALLRSVPFSTYQPASYVTGLRTVHSPWHDPQPWYRWKIAHDEVRSVRQSGHLFDRHSFGLSDELRKFLWQTPAKGSASLEVHESITATVGKCIFAHGSFRNNMQINALRLGQMSPARAFVQEYPRATHLLGRLALLDTDPEVRSHRIRLVPSAFHREVFPPLELEFTSTRRGDCHLRSVKAVLMESKVDYLLPESAADLQFTRKHTHDLLTRAQRIPCVDSILDDLRDCFHTSMISNNDAPLPVFRSITLPNNLLRRAGEEIDPDGWTTAEYLYPSVKDIQMTYVSKYSYDDTAARIFYSEYESPESPQDGTEPTKDLSIELDWGTLGANNAEALGSGQVSQEKFHAFCLTACGVVTELDSPEYKN